jgi:hypothetical protein
MSASWRSPVAQPFLAVSRGKSNGFNGHTMALSDNSLCDDFGFVRARLLAAA